MSISTPLVTTSPDRLSGTPVFAGTRVPVQTLIDYLEAGDPLAAFLADFPSVSREHAAAVRGHPRRLRGRRSQAGLDRRPMTF